MSATSSIHLPLGAIPSVWTSLLVMFTLIVIFAASWAMFWILAERSTGQRYWVAMTEWGRERGYRFAKVSENEPALGLFQAASGQRVVVRVCLAGKQTKLIQVESFAAPVQDAAAEFQPRAGIWNVLVREIETSWPATGLRPASAASSALDLFPLTSFPLLGGSERFVVFGTGSRAAASLSRSAARGLMPRDVGLLLHGRNLVLDFSTRPFDTIEFERMIVVAEQLVSHLPTPDAGE